MYIYTHSQHISSSTNNNYYSFKMTCNESYNVKINGTEYEILEPSDEHWCFLDQDFSTGIYNIEFSTRIDSEEQAKDPQFVKELAQSGLDDLGLQNHFKLPDELVLDCPENEKPFLKKYNFENGNPFTYETKEKPFLRSVNYHYEKNYIVSKEEYDFYFEEELLEKFVKDLKKHYTYYTFQVNLIQIKKL